jgi:hypothetical protein
MRLVNQQSGDAHVDQPLPQSRILAAVTHHRAANISFAAVVLQQPPQRVTKRTAIVGGEFSHALVTPPGRLESALGRLP